MILPPDRELFNLGDRALVVPVNCHGVMGAGIAKEVKTRWPGIVSPYSFLCARHLLHPGGVQVVNADGHTFILIATKNHWRRPSRIEWINTGLRGLAALSPGLARGIHVPALGCGRGDLPWSAVGPLIAAHLTDAPHDVYVYPHKEPTL